MNMQAILKQAQNMQKDMMKAKEEVDNTVFVGESSLVKVEVYGTKKIKTVKINSTEPIETDEIEMLEDMFLVAINSAFEKVESWMLKLATPAAAVAVAVGLFMKKFSFGDEERLRIAKKLIRGSLFSYAFILVLDLILSAISSLLT